MASGINDQTSKDIQDLNITYLFCLREMAREDPAEAAVRFGVEQSLAKAVAELSIEGIREIANPAMLQFKIRAPIQMRSVLKGGDETALLKAAISMISETIDE